MEENYEKRQKTALIQRRREQIMVVAILSLSIIAVIILLFVGVGIYKSGGEKGIFLERFGINKAEVQSDYVQEYITEERKVEIKKKTGEKAIDATLKTELKVRVGLGYQKVAEIEIESYEDYDNLIKSFRFEDIRDGRKGITRQIDLKVWRIGDVQVPIIEKISNGYGGQTEIITGYKTEQQYDWFDLTNSDFKAQDVKLISLWTYIEEAENIEWIPTLTTGVEEFEIVEWAEWEASLTVGLEYYYALDGGSGDVIDSLGGAGGNNSGAVRGVSGVIDDCFDFERENSDYVDIPGGSFPNGTNDFTISLWVWEEAEGAWRAIFGNDQSFHFAESTSSDDALLYFDAGNSVQTGGGNGFPTETWTHVVITRSATSNVSVYFNNVSVIYGTMSTSITAGSAYIGNNVNSQYWDGLIDEVGIWNRALTEVERSNLYHNGNGLAYPGGVDDPPVTSLNFPTADANYSTVAELLVNCSATDDNQVDNVTVYLNGVANKTETGATTFLEANYTITVGEGIWNLSCNATDSTGQVDAAGTYRHFIVDLTPPTIALTTPNETFGIIKSGDTLGLNWTVSDDHGLSSCWYNYNGTNVFTDCGTNTTTFLNDDNNRNVTFNSNDTFGNANSSTIYWNYKIFENSQTYSSPVGEDTTTNIIINVTYDNVTYTDINATLFYNNTRYNATDPNQAEATTTFNQTVSTPIIVSQTDVNFYWQIELSDGTKYNATTQNQTISTLQTIEITNGSCSANTFEAVNYSFQSAGNLTNLEVDIDYNFKYGVANLSAEQIYGSFDNTTVLRICVNETADYYKLGYGEIDYSTAGYTERRYYMFYNHSLSNSTTEEYTLYDIINSDATVFSFTFRDSTLTTYDGKYAALLRWYPDLDEYRVVEMAKTDGDGQAVMKLHTEDVDYRWAIYHVNGTLIYLADPVRLVCSSSPCTQTLTVPSEASEDWDNFLGLDHSLTYSSGVFTFSFNDPSQETSEIRLDIYRDTGASSTLICNDSAASYTGILTCNVSAWNGNLRAMAYRTASPETTIATALISTTATVFQGTLGLFITVILAIVIILMGVISPILAVILSIVALIPALIFGVLPFQIIILIAAMGGIVIHFMKKAE